MYIARTSALAVPQPEKGHARKKVHSAGHIQITTEIEDEKVKRRIWRVWYAIRSTTVCENVCYTWPMALRVMVVALIIGIIM